MDSPARTVNILCVEDSMSAATLIRQHLQNRWPDLQWTWVQNERQLTEALDSQSYDCILSDVVMPGLDTKRVIEKVSRLPHYVPVIAVSGQVSIEGAVDLMKAGASGFVRKDDLDRLGPEMEQAMRESDVRRRHDLLELKSRAIENRYRSLFDNSPMCIHDIDPDGRLIAMNRSGLDMLNLDHEDDVIGREVLSLVGEDDRERIGQLLQSALRGNREYFEFRGVGAASSQIFSSNFIPIRDHRGAVSHIAGITQDVTEQRLAEERLRESEEKFTVAFQSHPTPMQILNIQTGERLEINESCVRLYESDRASIESKTLYERNRWVKPEQQRESINELVEKKVLTNYPIEVYNNAGEVMYLMVSAAMLEVGDGNLAVLSYVNVTEQRIAETALRESESRWRTLINTLPDPVWLKDMAGNYLGCNSQYEKYIGRKESELLGRNDREMETRTNWSLYEDYERQVIDTGEPVRFEAAVRYAGETELRWMEAIKAPMRDSAGRMQAILGVARDITERHRHDELVQLQARRAQAVQKLHQLSPGLTDVEYIQKALDYVEQLTESPISFCHYVLGNEDTIELITWSKRTLQNYCRAVETDHYPVSRAGIWAEAVRERKPMVFNDYAGYDQKNPLPEGHAALDRVISVPVFEGDRIVMLLGVGNKPEDFTDNDVATVEILGNEIWSLVQRRNAERQATRFSAALERSMSEIYIFEGRNLTITDANLGATSSLGYTLGEMEHLTPPDIMPDIDREEFERLIQPLRDQQRPVIDLVTRLRRKDGSTYPVEVQLEMMHDEPKELVAVARDISERTEMEAQMRKLAQAVEQTSNTVVITNLDAEIEYANPAFEQATGYSLEEVLGRNLSLLNSGKNDPAIYEALWTNLEKGESWNGVFINRRKDGSEFMETATITPIKSPEGEVTHYLAVKQDITETKRLEEELTLYQQHLEDLVEQRTAEADQAREEAERISKQLRENQDRYAEAAQAAHLGHWETHEDEGVFLHISEEYARIHGYSAAEFRERFRSLEKDFEDTVFEDDKARVRSFYDSTREGEIEFRIVRKDGSLRYVRENFVSLKDESTGANLCRGTFQDITDLKQAEQALRDAKEAAEAAAQAKADFLANMSHEIRTPMNAILGLTHLLMQSRLDGEQVDRLVKIEDSSRHLLTIINDILDLSKIEAGKLEIERFDFNIRELLEQVMSMVRDQSEAKELDLGLEVDDLPEWLLGDATRLRQALLNYASNAVKFTQQGSVTIRALRRETGPDGICIRFEVEDTGAGLSEKQLTSVFEAFEQADRSITRRHGGTGLGLAITRRLVELMGGECGAQSALGEGSRFWFDVTLKPGSEPAFKAVKAGDKKDDPVTRLLEHYGGSRVLVVEDNAINQEVAVELLKRVGLEIDTANDGLQALKCLEDGDYDLVLMDVQMPVMDGLQTTRQIREQDMRARGGDRMPVLAMTANIFEDDRRACLEAGMDGFVAKPVEPHNLFSMLLEWLTETGQISMPEHEETGDEPLPEEKSIRARLGCIDGLDLETGLLNLSGDFSGYVKLLEQLVISFRSDLVELGRQLADQDFEAARKSAHTLKGAAGTLGLKRIQSTALDLEQACRDMKPGDSTSEPRTLADDIEAMLEQVSQALQPAAAPMPGIEEHYRPINPARLQRVFADDREAIDQLLLVFLGQARSVIPRVQEARKLKNKTLLAEEAHKLRSTARSVGAEHLADICSVLMTAANSGDWHGVDVATRVFIEEVNRVRCHIESL